MSCKYTIKENTTGLILFLSDSNLLFERGRISSELAVLVQQNLVILRSYKENDEMKFMKITISLVFTLFLIVSCDETKNKPEEKEEGKETVTVVEETVDHEKKLADLERQLASDPDNSKLLTERALLLMRINRLDEGFSDMSKAFRLDSLDLGVRKAHGDYMLAMTRVLAARKDYNYVIENDPSNAQAYLGMARTYAIEDYYEKAFEFADEALKRDKFLRDAYELKGLMFRAQNKTELAISSYQTAVEMDPDFYSGFIALGNLFEQKNDPIAYEYYKAAHEIDTAGLEALHGMALFLQYHNGETEAKDLYRKILEYDSTYFIAYYNQGWIKLVLENEMDSATYFFERTLEIVPNYADAWYNLGLSQVEKNNRNKAIECFKNVLKINPEYKGAQEQINDLLKL